MISALVLGGWQSRSMMGLSTRYPLSSHKPTRRTPQARSATALQLSQRGPSAYVKSFGRRLAYESLRRTNPRCAVLAYGDLRIWLCWGERLRRCPGLPASAWQRLCRATGAQIPGNRCAKQAMASGIGGLNGAGEPLCARGVDGRSHKATTWRRHGPCRVTASRSRLAREEPAARAVASSVGRSR